MKLKVIYLALALVLVFSMAAVVLPAEPALAQDEVNFPDPILREAIRDAIGGGDITQDKLDLLTSFSYGEETLPDVTDLTGLDHCTSLTWLQLYQNQISDLSPLSSLTSLTWLWLQFNEIIDLSPLSSLVNLEYLYIGSNQISDISPLSSLTSLTELWLEVNQISDISPLSSLTSLTSMNLQGNQINDLSPLSSLTNLTWLDLWGNEISDVSPLSSLTSLQYLTVGWNQISDLPPFSLPTSLIHLELQGNQISDISSLSLLTSLQQLYLGSNGNWGGNHVSDIQPLVANPGLAVGDIVDLSNNPLSTDTYNVYIPQLQGKGVEVRYDLGNTPVGTNVEVSPVESLGGAWLNVTFPSVSVAGYTYGWYIQSQPDWEPIPSEFQEFGEGGYYTVLDTSAQYTGPITMNIEYPDDDPLLIGIDESTLKILSWNGIQWEDVTIDVDTVNNRIRAYIDVLSPFTMVEFIGTEPPLETLSISFGETICSWLSSATSNLRPTDLQAGDEIIQFTRDNLVVGTNPSSTFITADSPFSVTVSGDLSGTITQTVNQLDMNWDGMGGTSMGYAIGKATFDDGAGNTFSGFHVSDTDTIWFPSGDYTITSSGYMFSDSGTGEFAGQIIMGTLSATGVYNASSDCITFTGTSNLDRYDNSGFSSYPLDMAGTNIWGDSRDIGPSGSLTNDEYIQFTRPNIVTPPDQNAWYMEAGSTIASGTIGPYAATATNTHNFVTVGAVGGFSISKVTISAPSSTLNGINVQDHSAGSAPGYVVGLTSDGAWADRDWYASYITDATGDPFITSGTFYILESSCASTSASTGTGAIELCPSSGTVQSVTDVAAPPGQPNLQFPHGFIEFAVTGLTNDETFTLTLTYPGNIPTNAQYWKYGPTPSDSNPHWYTMPIGSNNGDNVITLQLTNGAEGDDTWAATDFVLVDQGGPGWPAGAGATGVPVFPTWYIGIVAALGAGVIAYLLRRRALGRKTEGI